MVVGARSGQLALPGLVNAKVRLTASLLPRREKRMRQQRPAKNVGPRNPISILVVLVGAVIALSGVAQQDVRVLVIGVIVLMGGVGIRPGFWKWLGRVI